MGGSLLTERVLGMSAPKGSGYRFLYQSGDRAKLNRTELLVSGSREPTKERYQTLCLVSMTDFFPIYSSIPEEEILI